MNPTPKKKPSNTPICLRQVFLPYHDPVTQQRGWQFGIETQPQKGSLYQHVAELAPMSVLVLLDDGTHTVHPFPNLKQASHTKGTPPSPLWAWCPVELPDGNRDFACVVEPVENKGSQPLSGIQSVRGKPFFLTPTGVHILGLVPTLYDLPYEVVTEAHHLDPEGDAQQWLPLQLGSHTLGEAVVRKSGTLLGIQASTEAVELGLWTSHLVRVFDVLYGFRQ